MQRVRRVPVRRGEIEKYEVENKLILERRFILKHYKLTLDRDRCIVCGICADLCPKDAIEYVPPEFDGIRRVREPQIDFDNKKCVLCGECVTACPMNALSMEIEGEERIPVVDANVFASLIKYV